MNRYEQQVYNLGLRHGQEGRRRKTRFLRAYQPFYNRGYRKGRKARKAKQ